VVLFLHCVALTLRAGLLNLGNYYRVSNSGRSRSIWRWRGSIRSGHRDHWVYSLL